MHLLGLDIGSSSVKATLLDGETGIVISSAVYPETELEIHSPQPGWAEQDPEIWWESIKKAIGLLRRKQAFDKSQIKAIGIAYQMHGLVAVDSNLQPVRPAIIWCDSRAVKIGEKAFGELGGEYCLEHCLNAPGNFTASKLKWVMENEPDNFSKIRKIMLPGDYIAMKMTGEINTTVGGLSEGIFWDFKENRICEPLLEYFGIPQSLLPDVVPAFGPQGKLTRPAAAGLGLSPGIPVTYRAGDQSNNALSLGVLNPGDIAATAGTSGVVYGVSDKLQYDPLSRVNTFAHVNHTSETPRLGVLLCINGTGIMNAWLKKLIKAASYEEMNSGMAGIAPGADGLVVLPFGNGAERMLQNKNPGARILNLDLNRHTGNHIARAAHEGIAFAFKYGMDILKQTGADPSVIRAGNVNMFRSPVFRETLAAITGTVIELYNTDGSTGAARGAGLGAKVYKTFDEAFANLKIEKMITPKYDEKIVEAYQRWEKQLQTLIR